MKKNKIPKHTTFEYLKLIFSIDKRYLVVLIIGVFASLFWTIAPLGLTNYLLKIYEVDNSMKGYQLILILCAIYTFFRIIVSTVTMFIYNEYVERIYRKFNYVITSKILKKILDVDLETYQSPEFLNNYQKVVDNVTDNMVGTFWDITSLVEGLTSLIGLGTILSVVNPIILIYGVIIGIASYYLSKLTSKIMHNLSEKNKQLVRQRGYVRRLFYLKEYSIDLRTTKINELYLDKNDEYGEEIIQNLKKHYRKYNLFNSLDHILLNSFFAVSLSLVTMAVIKENNLIILATLMSAIIYLSDDINYFASSIASYKKNIIYKSDYYRLMDEYSEIELNNKKQKIEEFQSIDFVNVSFKYGEKQAIQNVNVKIKSKDKIAIVGENGAGKTTFIKLLLRLYDPTQGQIYFNDIDYKEYNSKDLRKQFVTVFQDYQIYAISIAENILLRKCETKEDELIVINALKKVGLYEKVKKMKEGIHTICTTEFDDKGIEFSGGERQKFVIARIFASNSPIILLDEPNSALDPIAEKEIFEEIFKYSIDKTLIFISHRFSTTIHSDKIYLFSDGKILEEGTHQELMAIENGEYKRMFNIQACEYLKRGEVYE